MSSVKVKVELAMDVKVSTLKTVQVNTHRGEVTLTGKVYTQEPKEHAAKIAS
jgi:osmotically-inducible protein OsmY